MVRDGKWATTHDSTLFGQEVRPSRQDRLLCLTLIFFSLSVPKEQEVHPNSSGSTNDSRVSRLKDVLQLPDSFVRLVSSGLMSTNLQPSPKVYLSQK